MSYIPYNKIITYFLSVIFMTTCLLSRTAFNILTCPCINIGDKNQITCNKLLLKEQLLLPRNLYILQGMQKQALPYTIYYDNVLSSFSSPYTLSSYHSHTHYIYGTSNQVSFKNHSASHKPLSFELSFYASTCRKLLCQHATVSFVPTANTTPIRLLAIGDSLTRCGIYLREVEQLLPNATSIGTRYYPDDDLPAREGRGGWCLDDYFNFYNDQGLDSPFMFPTEISGEHYKGNTRDWQNICYHQPTSPTYNGFQKLARNWCDEGEFLYDDKGYYRYPAMGDVMYNPDLGENGTWLMWQGASWNEMIHPPTSFEFNFTKYMIKNHCAFTEGAPTHVSILLGANDFGLGHQLDQMPLYIERLHAMITSIHAYDPEIKIILCIPPLGPDSSRITSHNQSLYTNYTICMKYTAACLINAFDNDEALMQQVYLAPMHLTVDPNLGFTYITKVETTDTLPVIDVKNSIHPNNHCGQRQMGLTLASVLQMTINQQLNE